MTHYMGLIIYGMTHSRDFDSFSFPVTVLEITYGKVVCNLSY